MFLWNVEKCLKIFEKVYVSSDSPQIMKLAESVGAIPIPRGEELCGDTPDIPVFQHALGFMRDADGLVAVHANNPNIDSKLIELVKLNLEAGVPEVMTSYPMEDRLIVWKEPPAYKDQHSRVNGSIRGMLRERLENYPDAYKPRPEVLIVDDSIEIETQEDYEKCLLTQAS